jgi:CPA1 family monovalent cation:H+ antiporter
LAILEGEGLVNDATALVLLRSAVAAMGAGVTAGGVIGDFVVAVLGAVAVGAVVGVLNVRIRRWIGDSVMNTAISFVVPFIAYLPAEDFGFSGVLAVVVAGLVTSDLAARYLKAEDRITEATNWKTLSFLMEGFIFLLMGISLEDVLFEAGSNGFSIGQAVLYGIIASLLLILVRFVFVVPLVAMIRRDDQKAVDSKKHVDGWKEKLRNDDLPDDIPPRRLEGLERRVAMVSADIEFRMRESLGWRAGAVLAWSGMRGAVTVAAAQTLPVDTPFRAELVLIAYVGAALMLLLQGSTLPLVIRKLKVEGDSPEELARQYAELRVEISDAGENALEFLTAKEKFNPLVLEQVRKDSLVGREENRVDVGVIDRDRNEYIRLRLVVIEAERQRMLHHRSLGTYSSEVIDNAQRLLDLEEARLQQLADQDD